MTYNQENTGTQLELDIKTGTNFKYIVLAHLYKIQLTVFLTIKVGLHIP